MTSGDPTRASCGRAFSGVAIRADSVQRNADSVQSHAGKEALVGSERVYPEEPEKARWAPRSLFRGGQEAQG